LAVVFLSCVGCGFEGENAARQSTSTKSSLHDAGISIPPGSFPAERNWAVGGPNDEANERTTIAGGQISAGGNPGQPQDVTTFQLTVPGRQIVYTAKLTVQVESFDSVADRVAQIVQAHGGHIAQANIGRLQGTNRYGTWTVRIPVDRYRGFLTTANGLGVPVSLTESASDVTEEFVDLDARILSKKQLEQGYAKLIERPTEKIDDLFAVERELSRVRLEIEQMEGRRRFLADQVALSTVTITISEQTTFIPAEKPTLGSRIHLEWSEAVKRAGRFGEDFVVGCVANSFVIVGWAAGFLIAWWLFARSRRWSRRMRATNRLGPTPQPINS
jgi:hypothetical protein